MKTIKTKIVTTIGSAYFSKVQGTNKDEETPSEKGFSSYCDGIYNLQGQIIKDHHITYDYLVKNFCTSGTDIIRMNLSHINTSDIPGVFMEIKRAILEWENQNKGRTVGVLADLPGPKIRFHMSTPVDFSKIDRFTIHFERKISTATEATIFVNDKPLKPAMLEIDKNSRPHKLAGSTGAPRNRDTFKKLLEQISGTPGVTIVVGDGDVVLEPLPNGLDIPGACLTCRIITVKKAVIEGKKGFTLKGAHIHIPSFTQEDQEKLDTLIETEYADSNNNDSNRPVIAFLALSFAQSSNDVLRLCHHLECKLQTVGQMDSRTARLMSPAIIAKIETELGWQNRDHILDAADGIMVARGDLGLQMNIETVPRIQKELIRLCNKRGKPVITATEMLKSMTAGIEPTRAEATDVFNAILDGSDAVMTSDETSIGKYPFHAISKMRQIAQQAESYFELEHIEEESLRRAASLQRYQEFLEDDYKRIEKTGERIKQILAAISEQIGAAGDETECPMLSWQQKLYQSKLGKTGEQPTTNRITQATCMMSEAEEVKYIIAVSTSGRTVRMIARLRPRVMIIGAAHDIVNTRKLTVSYGVKPIYTGKVTSPDPQKMFEKCREMVLEDPALHPPAEEGDLVIFSAGTPLGKPGTTNLIKMMKF